MRKVEEIKNEIAKLEELGKKQFEEKQRLYKELRKAEKEEKETRFIGKPQLFRFNGGYDGCTYISAITKEDAIDIFKQNYPDAENVEKRIDTLGVQLIRIEFKDIR